MNNISWYSGRSQGSVVLGVDEVQTQQPSVQGIKILQIDLYNKSIWVNIKIKVGNICFPLVVDLKSSFVKIHVLDPKQLKFVLFTLLNSVILKVKIIG